MVVPREHADRIVLPVFGVLISAKKMWLLF
jgi:hypothetical protein